MLGFGALGQLAPGQSASLATDISGTAGIIEGADRFAAAGTVVRNDIAAVEASDAANYIGFVATRGLLAATEAKDTAALTGRAGGRLDATEARDTASLAGSLRNTLLLAAYEDPDGLNFMGELGWMIVPDPSGDWVLDTGPASIWTPVLDPAGSWN